MTARAYTSTVKILAIRECKIETNWRRDANGQVVCDRIPDGWSITFGSIGPPWSVRLENMPDDWNVGDDIELSLQKFSK
jgi:hypothetical protein